MLQNLIRASALVLTASLSHSPTHAQSHPPLKVAFVYVTPIGEAGWTYQHNLGRLAMEKALGDQVRTTVVEGVAEGPDSERVIRDLASQGNTLIFAASSHNITALLSERPAYDPIKDFTAVANVGMQSYVLMTSAEVPARSVGELIAHAKFESARDDGDIFSLWMKMRGDACNEECTHRNDAQDDQERNQPLPPRGILAENVDLLSHRGHQCEG